MGIEIEVKNAWYRCTVNFIEDKGCMFLNGNFVGDETGEFTFIGPRGSSDIDYAIERRNGRKN